MDATQVRYRSLDEGSTLAQFLTLPYSLNDEIVDDIEAHRRRPEWMWVAELDGLVVARLAWWSNPGEDAPELLDILDVRDARDGNHLDAAGRLLATATAQVVTPGERPPEYLRFVPPDWRVDDDARVETEALMTLAAGTGARLFVERRRLEWRAGTQISPRSGRLRFRAPHGDAEILALMTEASAGTLDEYTRLDLETMSPADAARKHFYGEIAAQVGPRRWRVAIDHDGHPVGFVTPGHNHYHPVIGYLAVLPRYRGQGYVDEILNEGVSVLAATGVDHIRAATDLGNTPMGDAFKRNGWAEFERSINMTWRPPSEKM
ncbi:MAG TPA: GNAT family N-acetyltransferase [Acidimicrobiia bacterium]|nr:GNAT family N-acetyltransferase [Acidimicrobiia bacterium]